MSVDAIHDLHVIVQDLRRRIEVLEVAAKPLADQVTPPIMRVEDDKWPKKTTKTP